MISTLEDFIVAVRADRAKWGPDVAAWFRGEPVVDQPLLPKVFRKKEDGGSHDENQLLQMFRMKAPSFAPGQTPNRGDTDQWLFLAQHVGVPTRLLDWTESALIGLYFALRYSESVVWMLTPFRLNMLSVSDPQKQMIEGSRAFPLTWYDPPGDVRNIGVENIKGAWQTSYDGLDLPVAVHPTYLHPRMSAQRSVFTIHGARKEPLSEIVPKDILKRYDITPGASEQIRKDLLVLGIHHSTAFPDLDGLAKELCDLY